MVNFFPTPYPDELLYSNLTRYHIRSGNRSFKQTLFEVLGYFPQQLCNLDLPNNLQSLISHTPVSTKFNVEDVIYNSTLYPFYKIFLTQPEAFLLKDLMKKKVGKPIFQVAKIAVIERDVHGQFLRFCDQCLEEDLQKYGEAYWHRTHQVPGVLVCLEHEKLLNDSLVPLQDGYLGCYLASQVTCQIRSISLDSKESTLRQLIAIAKEIKWLCDNHFNFRGFQWLRKQYQSHLVDQGFVSDSSSKVFKFHEEKFWNDISSVYGHECLNLLLPNLEGHGGRYFYRCLFACDIEPFIDRVAHVLLIQFLLKSLNVLLEG
ncbi:TniQ family protein [Leptolyngbya sp. AN02str]|uniref:TniQ family protein n=1 Tax=Leptolyngbya sp. AN02str TaxID=3423363 RepID=UPI003D317966